MRGGAVEAGWGGGKSQARMTFQTKIHPQLDPTRELRVCPRAKQESWAFILLCLSFFTLQ